MADLPTVTLDQLPADALVLDVREDDEWAAGHIDGALHVPMNQVPTKVAYEPGELTTDTPVYVICKMGGRSGQVTRWLNQHGFDARNVEGGMLGWAGAGRPMTSDNGGPAEVI